MWLWRAFKWLFSERRFILVFGVLYTLSVVEILRRTASIESDLEVTLNRSIRKEVTPKKLPTSGKIIRVRAVRHPLPPNIENAVSGNANKSGSTCDNLRPPLFLAPGKAPLTALASFPGSGNTWVRVLLSSLTGLITGDIYKDGSFAKTPGFSYRKDDTVVAVKTHHPFWDDSNGPDISAPMGRQWERAIVLVRHPLDATISGFNFFRSKGSHTKIAPLEKFLKKDGKPTKDWNKWAHDQIRNWGRCLEYWVNVFKGPVVIIFYEDLISNLENQLLTINKFLGRELDQNRLTCTVQSNAQQKFHRTKKVDKRIFYDASMINEVEVVMAKVHTLLTHNYTHINPGFRIPDNYAVHLIRENFSVKPNISLVENRPDSQSLEKTPLLKDEQVDLQR